MDRVGLGPRVVRFGLYEVDRQERVLTKGGLRIRLQEQPFQVLALLLERPGELVTREEIQQRLWPADTFVAFDDGLNTAIKKLRLALGDSADNPRFIETVPRRGYRFIAPATVSAPVAATEAEKPDPSGRALTEQVVITSRVVIGSTASHRPRAWGVAVLVMVLAGGTAGYVIWDGHHRRAESTGSISGGPVRPGVPRPSIAVLGFRNLSRRPEEAWISTALSVMLTTELSSDEQIRIVPGESVARTRTSLLLPESESFAQDTLARIRKNLDADYVIVGSYFDLGKRTQGTVRLDLRLQDSQTGETVATISETGTEVGLPALAAQAGALLRTKLGTAQPSPAQLASTSASLPTGQEATRLYIEGLEKLRNFDNLGAQRVLERAVALEPKVALAHVALGDALAGLGFAAKAREEAERGFDVSGPLSREQRLWVEGRFREATHEWDKAIEVYRALFTFFPDNLEYGLRLAAAQVSAEQGKEAVATLTELRKLPEPAGADPRIDLKEGEAARSIGDYKRDEELTSRAIQKGRAIGARLLVAMGRHGECWSLHKLGQVGKSYEACSEAKRIFEEAGDRDSVASVLVTSAAVLEEQGKLAEASAIYERAIKVYRETADQGGLGIALNNLGIVQRNIGNHPAAKNLYQQAAAIARAVGDKQILILAQGNLASLAFYDGDLERARSSYEDLLITCRELGSKDRIALQLGNFGDVLYYQGDLSGGQRALEEAISLDRESGEKRFLGYHLASLADVLEAEGRLPEAHQQRLEALKIRNELADQGDIADSKVFLADSSIEEGHPADAEVTLLDAIAQLQALNLVDDEVYGYALLVRALTAQGKTAAAQAAVERGTPVARKCSDRGARFAFSIEESRAQAANGRLSEAIPNFQLLIADLNKYGYRGYQMSAKLSLGEAEMLAGRTREGQAFLTSLRNEAQAKGFVLIARKAAAALDEAKTAQKRD